MATQTAPKVSEALAQLVSGIVGGGIRVVDFDSSPGTLDADHPAAAPVRAVKTVLARGDLAL